MCKGLGSTFALSCKYVLFPREGGKPALIEHRFFEILETYSVQKDQLKWEILKHLLVKLITYSGPKDQSRGHRIKCKRHSFLFHIFCWIHQKVIFLQHLVCKWNAPILPRLEKRLKLMVGGGGDKLTSGI